MSVQDDAKTILDRLRAKPDLYYEVLKGAQGDKPLSPWFTAMIEVSTNFTSEKKLKERLVRVDIELRVVIDIETRTLVTGDRRTYHYAWFHAEGQPREIRTPDRRGVAFETLAEAQDTANAWLEEQGYLLA